MKEDLILPKKEIEAYNFYKWITPCGSYLEYIRLTAPVGWVLTKARHERQVNCFYFRSEFGHLVLYCSIVGNNEDLVIPEISKLLNCQPTKEAEFEPKTDQELKIAKHKYIAYDAITLHSISVTALIIDTINKAEKKKLSAEDNRFLAELQIMGMEISNTAQKIFGVPEEQIMFHYSEALREYFLYDIGVKSKQGKEI